MKEMPNDCYNENGVNTCYCDTDLCNNGNASTPIPPTTTNTPIHAGSSAVAFSLVGFLLCGLFSFINL